MKHVDNSHETVLVVDFAQYAQLIARRVRGVYSEIVPNTIRADEIAPVNLLHHILRRPQIRSHRRSALNRPRRSSPGIPL